MRLALVLVLLSLLTLPHSLAAESFPQFAVTEIGGIDAFSRHVAINNRGQIVGGVFTATLWQKGHTIRLGTFRGYPHSWAVAINDKGQVAGTLDNDTNGAILVIDTHGFLWKQGKMRDFGADQDFALSEPRGMNNRGEIVGRACNSGRPYDSDNPETHYHAFLYRQGQILDLGEGEAFDINDKGQIVGEIPGAVYPEATLWQQGKTINLGLHGVATVINNQGQIVIGWGGRDPLYLWQRGQARALPILPGSGMNEADGINNSGQIVGNAMLGSLGLQAMLWQNRQVYDLNSLIPAKSSWTLAAATSINDKGQIVGYGRFHGQEHAFLLTPLHH